MKTIHLLRIFLLTGLFLALFPLVQGYGQPYRLNWAFKIESLWFENDLIETIEFERTAIAVDGNGCSVITGGFSSEAIDFGGTTLTRKTTGSSSNYGRWRDFYVARYLPNGTLDWVRQAGNSLGNCMAEDVAVDGNGNIVVTGYYWACDGNPVNFYDGNDISGSLHPYSNTEQKDIFIARYKPDGDLWWVKRAGGEFHIDEGVAVTCRPDGSFFITGNFMGNAVFGEEEDNETILSAGENGAIFVAKYDFNGLLVWAKKATGYNCNVNDVASDSDGNCMIAGHFATNIIFNQYPDQEISLTGSESGNMFVACFNDQGMAQWAKSAEVNSDNNGYSLDADSEGNCIVTGGYEGLIDFGGGFSFQGEENIYYMFIAKYDPSGTLSWAKAAGVPSNPHDGACGLGLVTDNSDNILVTGLFIGEVTFGAGSQTPTELTSIDYDPRPEEAGKNSCDVFTLKCDPSGELLWARSDGGILNDKGNDIALGPDGSVFVTGIFNDDATFGDGLTDGPVALTTEEKQYNLFVFKMLQSETLLEITSLTGPVMPFPVNTEAALGVSFTGGLVTATIDWGDGNASTLENQESPFTALHVYTQAGVYPVTVTVVNENNQSDQETWNYSVVYDPSAGFVTGGGWIISPPGAYKAGPLLTGKANFGFVSKYQKGKTIPEGNTEFQFKTASLNFRSSNYEWLVIAGSKAMFKGSGSINGAGNFGFLLSAIDGNLALNQTPDKFRIKIWDNNNGELVVYDNNINDDLNADPETSISGGSVVIHSNVKKSAVMENSVILPDDKPRLSVYPNPFTDRLWFELTTPETVRASIDLYDITGRKVATLLDRTLESGESCRVDYVPGSWADNCVLYRVIVGNEVFNGKVISRK